MTFYLYVLPGQPSQQETERKEEMLQQEERNPRLVGMQPLQVLLHTG